MFRFYQGLHKQALLFTRFDRRHVGLYWFEGCFVAPLLPLSAAGELKSSLRADAV